jgi:aminoglycoside 3-N-acetyltransferase
VDEIGRRVWQAYEEIELDASSFVALGTALEETGFVRHGVVGAGDARLFSQRSAVDFAAHWFGRE